MSRLFVYPYKAGSLGAKAIAGALGGKVLKRENSRYRHREGDVIVNWGASDFLEWRKRMGVTNAVVMNNDTVAATDKLEFFRQARHSEFVPHFCESIGVARELEFPVVCRTKLRGRDGDGIVIAETPEELVPAPLYTEYKKKTAEYRVHVCRGESELAWPFAAQQKLRPRNAEVDQGFRVRNYGAGFRFFYSVDGEWVLDNLPKKVWEAAEEVFDEFPCLDFGAMDIIYHKPTDSAYVLEINTAPGQCDKTTGIYAKTLEWLIRERIAEARGEEPTEPPFSKAIVPLLYAPDLPEEEEEAPERMPAAPEAPEQVPEDRVVRLADEDQIAAPERMPVVPEAPVAPRDYWKEEREKAWVDYRFSDGFEATCRDAFLAGYTKGYDDGYADG